MYLFFISALLLILPLDGKLVVQDEPTAVIKSLDIYLQRPEGVAFSPSGNCLAVACSEGNSIELYKRIGNRGARYESSPSCVIQNPELLFYAHDIEFSPCGGFLAVACREANRVVIFKMDKATCTLQNEPHCVLEGLSSNIDNPSGLSFSPCGQILAVCNRKGGSGITFYRQLENRKGQYNPVPFLEITEAKLLEFGLSAPHGIKFSPDGKSLAVVHKRYFKNKAGGGESAVALFEESEGGYTPFSIILRGITCLHSIDFHPKGHHLVTTNEKFDVSFYSQNEAHGYEPSFDMPIKIPENCPCKGGGGKGVAFSSDGKYMAITTLEPSILIYEVSEFNN